MNSGFAEPNWWPTDVSDGIWWKESTFGDPGSNGSGGRSQVVSELYLKSTRTR